MMDFPINRWGNTVEDSPRAWNLATHLGDLDEADNFQLQPGPALIILTSERVNQQMDSNV